MKGFTKTDTIVLGKIPQPSTTIASYVQEFQKVAKANGFHSEIYDAISGSRGSFPEEPIMFDISSPSVLMRFQTPPEGLPDMMTSGEIDSRLRENLIYQEFSLVDAIARATQLVAAGEVHEDGTSIIINLVACSDEKEPRALYLWLRPGSNTLYLFVRERTHVLGGLISGGGVLASNELAT